MRRNQSRYGCSKCGKPVPIKDGKLSCCGNTMTVGDAIAQIARVSALNADSALARHLDATIGAKHGVFNDDDDDYMEDYG